MPTKKTVRKTTRSRKSSVKAPSGPNPLLRLVSDADGELFLPKGPSCPESIVACRFSPEAGLVDLEGGVLGRVVRHHEPTSQWLLETETGPVWVKASKSFGWVGYAPTPRSASERFKAYAQRCAKA